MITTSTPSSSTDGPDPDRDDALTAGERSAAGAGPSSGSGTSASPISGMALPAAPGVPPLPAQPNPPAGVIAPSAAAPDAAASLPDPGRRAFFKSFSRQAFNTAAQVVGMTNAVTKATTNVAVGVVGLAVNPEGTADKLQAAGLEPGVAPVAPAAPATPTTAQPAQHKSPYRLMADQLYLLDQRGLPERLDEQVCRRGSDVAFYMRVMAIRGGPLMGQVAAYGLALTAREFVPRTWHARQAEWKRVCRALVAARPGSRMLRFAIERMSLLHETFGPDVDATLIADRLRQQADALAMESQLDHATIARTLAALLPRPEGRSLHLLVHGAPGTSTGGHIGTALNAIALIAQEERPVKVWVTETRPYLEGARLATWELGPTGVEVVVLPDSAVGYLLDHETIDALLMGAEWIAANGDTSNVIGSRVVAEMAAIARKGPVPVYIATPATTIDPAMADGDALPVELRPGREIVTHLAGWRPERPNGYLPSQDVIPAARITAFVTEQGTLAPDPDALAAALAARTSKRTPIGPPYQAPAPVPSTAAADADPPTPDGRAPGAIDTDEDEDPEAAG